MNSIELNYSEVQRWFQDMGDYTHNINYNLNSNSIVMDFGGCTGIWAQQIIHKYNPFMYILEPIPEFYNILVDKFKNNNKVQVINIGVSNTEKIDKIYFNKDGSSSNLIKGEPISVIFHSVEYVMNLFNLKSVDLLQINIEGDEYIVLEHMLKTKIINKFKNIQIQFHLGIENDISRREQIQKGLIENGFKNKFNYPFVWEGWAKN